MIVALISGGVTLAGVLASNSRSRAVMEQKIDELTWRVEKHNCLVERTYLLERDVAPLRTTSRTSGGRRMVMNEFLTGNERWRLVRTVAQGVLGVVVANLDLLVGTMALAPEWRPGGRARYGGAAAGDGRGREARQRRWRSGGWRCRVKDWEKCTADVDKIMNKHFRSGCADSKIQHIVIHYNVGGLTVEGCWQTWQTHAVSAHYQVESSGRIGQLVWDKDTAWHAGNSAENRRSIGIEHANRKDGTTSDICLDNGACAPPGVVALGPCPLPCSWFRDRASLGPRFPPQSHLVDFGHR